jgi:NAD(P)-dependent dehydrogenase (short-subunit alcohol dehydrogenase family)
MSSPVVLITCALTGIGRAAAVIFAQEGAHIVVSGRRDKQGQELVAELQGLGAEAIFVRTDVRKDEDVRNLVDQTIKRFGRPDIAVNNAGTEGLRGLVTEQAAESYADTFDTRQTSGNTGGDRSRDRLCRFGKCFVHDWRLHPGGWRDDRGLILGRW